jgi:hypothetical protein
MADSKHDLDRYRVPLSSGPTWEYTPRFRGDALPWLHSSLGRNSIPFDWDVTPTPADYRACAEVVERFEADHAPKMRRRVLYVDFYYWTRHETLGGFVYGVTESEARNCAKHQDYCDTIKATDANLAMLADLAARPDEEYSDAQ